MGKKCAFVDNLSENVIFMLKFVVKITADFHFLKYLNVLSTDICVLCVGILKINVRLPLFPMTCQRN